MRKGKKPQKRTGKKGQDRTERRRGPKTRKPPVDSGGELKPSTPEKKSPWYADKDAGNIIALIVRVFLIVIDHFFRKG